MRAQERETTRRRRAWQARHGLTFHELRARSPIDSAETLRTVMRDLVRSGLVDYHSTSRRYCLNGGLPDDVRLALRDLEL